LTYFRFKSGAISSKDAQYSRHLSSDKNVAQVNETVNKRKITICKVAHENMAGKRSATDGTVCL
jgi:hypothetical protein